MEEVRSCDCYRRDGEKTVGVDRRRFGCVLWPWGVFRVCSSLTRQRCQRWVIRISSGQALRIRSQRRVGWSFLTRGKVVPLAESPVRLRCRMIKCRRLRFRDRLRVLDSRSSYVDGALVETKGVVSECHRRVARFFRRVDIVPTLSQVFLSQQMKAVEL